MPGIEGQKLKSHGRGEKAALGDFYEKKKRDLHFM